MGRIGIYGILSVVLFGLIGCAPSKSDKEESVRLYKEAIVLLGSDSVTIDDCLAAQRLLEQALDADSENIDVSPLKEADKQVLIHSLSEFEFRQFGETWRAKHDALVANGQTETNTISNTFKK